MKEPFLGRASFGIFGVIKSIPNAGMAEG